ncbi:MAG: flagellar protein FlaG [Magnetococcales bacterium]|nr:flagellar protein FlaG [Magnetococcales bacterium]
MEGFAIPNLKIAPSEKTEGYPLPGHSSLAKKAVIKPETAVPPPKKGESSSNSMDKEGRQEAKLLLDLVDEVNQTLNKFTSLRFTVDQELEETIIRVVDSNTKEVVRQIPSDEMIDLAKRMQTLDGGIIDATA